MSIFTKIISVASFAIDLIFYSYTMRFCSSFSIVRSCESRLSSLGCMKINLQSISCNRITRFTNYHLFTTQLYSSSLKESNTATDTHLHEIIETPKFPDWNFKQIELMNGILVTLVHDGESEKSSCCLGVACGAKDDPPQLPGLAHFTEHAVFMGSHKYPIENAYKQFINQNGGRTNGGTGMEMTIFQFSIDSKAFPKALDIYSQFFKSPLFNSDSLSREIIAVDSEDSKNRILDGRRNLQLLKNLLSTKTNYETFSTGNLKTLGHVNQIESLKNKYVGHALKSNMLKFYNKHYTPPNMVLSLVGPQSLTELEIYAKEYFADIGNNPTVHINGNDAVEINATVSNKSNSDFKLMRDEKKTSIPIIPFCTAAASSASDINSKLTDMNKKANSAHMLSNNYPFKINGGKIVKSRPISDVNEVSILYAFPFTLRHLYRRNPFVLLSYILSNKYKNSLYDELFNKKKYIFALSAGVRESFIDFTLFEINIKFTEKGVDVYEEVISIINKYLQFVEEFFNQIDTCPNNTNQIPSSSASTNLDYLNNLWRELHISSEIDFKFQDRSTGYELVQELVDNMMRYERKHAFSGGWLIDETFTSTRIMSKYMIPESSMVFLRLTSHKDWIPTDLSDLDITDRKVLELIDNNNVVELLNLRSKTSEEIDVENHNIKVNRIERYYGIPYSIDDVHVDTMNAWKFNRYTSRNTTNSIINNSRSSDSDSGNTEYKRQQESIHIEENSIMFELPPLNSYICEELLITHGNHNDNNRLNKTRIKTIFNDKNNIVSQQSVSNIVTQIPHSPPPRLIAQHLLKSNMDSSIDTTLTNNNFHANKMPQFEKLYSQQSLSQLWYSRDELFFTPKSTIALFIFSPLCGDSHPINSMISTIYSQMTSYKYYPAAIAGLEYSTNLNNRGLQLTVSGYTPKLKKLMLDLCQDWLNTTSILLKNSDTVWNTMTEEYFNNLKKRSIQNIKSWYTSGPDSQSETILNYLLEENVKLPEEILNLTNNMQKEHVKERLAVVKNMTKLIMYVHGDLNETDVLDLHNNIHTKYFQESSNEAGHNNDINNNSATIATATTPAATSTEIVNLSDRIITNEVPARARILTAMSSKSSSKVDDNKDSNIHNRVILSAFNINDPNSALITYFQTERRSPRVSALQLVISRLFSEPLFSALRTTDQLGYIVSFSQANFGRYPDMQRGFLVKVLSKQFDPVYCEHRLNVFLLAHYDYINLELTQANVTSIGDSIVQSLIEPPKSFMNEANVYYDAIINNKPWNMTENVINEIKKLSLQDIQDYCNTYIFNKYHSRKTISIMLFGGSTDNSNNVSINENTKVTHQDVNNQPGAKAYEYIIKENKISYSELLKYVYDIDTINNNNSYISSESDKYTFVPLSNTDVQCITTETLNNNNSTDCSYNESNLYIGMKGVSEFRNQLPFL